MMRVLSCLSRRDKIGMETKDFMKEGRIPKEISFASSGYRDRKLINVLTCHHFSKELKGLSSGIIILFLRDYVFPI